MLENHRLWRKMVILTKCCLVCHKYFKVYQYRKDTAKFCSFACRNKSYKGKHFAPKTEFKIGQEFSKERNNKIGKALTGLQRVERIIKICLTCHKKFKIIPSLETKRQYCSLKCFYKDPKQIQRMIDRGKMMVFTKERNDKISQKMKGKLPKNWTSILKRKNKY